MAEVSIEAVPVAAGVAIGLLAWRLVPRRFRAAFVLGTAPLVAVLISYVGGELELSWAFAVFDIGQVVLAALFTVSIASGVRGRARARA